LASDATLASWPTGCMNVLFLYLANGGG